MSLLRQLQLITRNHLLSGAWRAAAAALLLAALAQPGTTPLLAAPIVAAPAEVAPLPAAPLAPQSGCGVVTNNSDNLVGSLRWTVNCVPAGATVTFQPALAGQTIALTTGDITVTMPITIDGSGAPGVKVDAGQLSRVFNISAGGTVTVKALTLQHGRAASGNGGAVLTGNTNTLVLDQVQVLSSTAPAGQGGGLYASTAILTGTQFISNTSSGNGGGAWVAGTTAVTNGRFERNVCNGSNCEGGGLNPGALTISGTQFISNTSDGQGGGLWAYDTADLSNAQFQNNNCTGSACEGGGLFANSTLTLTGTDLISNASMGSGGAAYASASAALTGGSFQGNQCVQTGCQGGGLYTVGGLTLIGTDFISNTSVSHGGGAWSSLAATLTNGRFQGNKCTGAGCQGGGLAADGTTLAVTGTDFVNNTSLVYGGGVVALGSVVLTNGSFQGNQCTDSIDGCNGGGLAVSNTLTLHGTNFISNTSTSNGGGVFAQSGALLTNGRFERNVCTGAGCLGGGLDVSSTLTLNGTNFISNTSVSHGGGLAAVGAASLTNGLFQGNQCTDSVSVSSCGGGGLVAGGALTLTGTQFISNSSTVVGGGIYVFSAATLTNGRFERNACTRSSGNGCGAGGLYAGAALTLTNTDFVSNTSTAGGGGAWVVGAARLTNGSFQGNKCSRSACQGGGLYASQALTDTGTSFIGNIAGYLGGGVYAQTQALVTNSLFQDNQCTQPYTGSPGTGCLGGGLIAASNLTASSTQFIHNSATIAGGGVLGGNNSLLMNDRFDGNSCSASICLGGGLYAGGTVLDSSFSGNQSAGSGGAVAISGTLQLALANVTLSGNTASVSGGGLFVGQPSTASLFNVTLADNQASSGGGLMVQAGASVSISNTLFSNNSANNCFGALGSGTHNLEWPAATCAAAGGPGAGFTTADPLLAPLALNPPGTTLTRALGPTSPARDAGDPATCANAPVSNRDQRGVVRPIRGLLGAGPAICDIGAFEAGPPMWFLFLPAVR